MAKIKITVDGYRCERCGHEWIPRTKITTDPKICPNCKTPYWDTPRKNKSK
jgi:predicted Zn-ribbon and HTH transcriptional regulator